MILSDLFVLPSPISLVASAFPRLFRYIFPLFLASSPAREEVCPYCDAEVRCGGGAFAGFGAGGGFSTFGLGTSDRLGTFGVEGRIGGGIPKFVGDVPSVTFFFGGGVGFGRSSAGGFGGFCRIDRVCCCILSVDGRSIDAFA